MNAHIDGMKELIADLDVVMKRIDQNDVNKQRAEAFKMFMNTEVSSEGLGLAPLSEASIKIRGSHPVMFNSGKLLEAIKIRKVPKQTAVDVGFFEGGRKAPESKLTYTQIAILQHTGFRIPVGAEEKGVRVRKYLAHFGIFPSSSKAFLSVPARPFLYLAAEKFVSSGEDQQIIDKFMKELY